MQSECSKTSWVISSSLNCTPWLQSAGKITFISLCQLIALLPLWNLTSLICTVLFLCKYETRLLYCLIFLCPLSVYVFLLTFLFLFTVFYRINHRLGHHPFLSRLSQRTRRDRVWSGVAAAVAMCEGALWRQWRPKAIVTFWRPAMVRG